MSKVQPGTEFIQKRRTEKKESVEKISEWEGTLPDV